MCAVANSATAREDARGVLVRIKKDGEFTEPFRWLVAAQDYMRSCYPLLPEAEEVHSDLERSELLSTIFDYCYEYLEDTPEAEEQAEWVAELANILFDEHSICDSAEFNYYAYDEEFDLNSIVHSFLTSKDLMAQEEEPLRPHRDVFLIDEEMVERNDWDPEDVGRWAFLIQGCYEFFDSQAAALAVYKAVFG